MSEPTRLGTGQDLPTVQRSRPEVRGRAGFDPAFLAPGPLVPVPLPVAAAGRSAPEAVVLPYTHFSVVLRPDRRLAAATVVGIDGARLRDVDREGSTWWLDPRVPQAQQAGEELYARNDLDRGHLVRRRDPVWGTAEEAERANADTFCYTNAAPQHAAFNQSPQLWNGLEDLVLAHAQVHAQRLVVVTGPVLDDADPVYRGVQVPLRFYKVVAHVRSGRDLRGGQAPAGLAASAFVLDQARLVERLLAAEGAGARAAGDAGAGGFDPGEFATYQVPVGDVATLTGLDLGPLVAADRMPVQASSAPGGWETALAGWQLLAGPADVGW
ncbi:DNA/RNA non-specific endonuclease [Kineococcus glutinatus]|uniref:Endonuclease G n=1 Tax=Kineococcus glutinatus TaxID=1070872 RepID=A0ABP9HI92_9ACTN